MLTATVVGGGLFAASTSAETSNNDDNLATKIAAKFNLNKDEVQTVVKEHHSAKQTEHKAERQAKLDERLTQAVKDGKLTEAQKTKVLEYLKSQETFMESLRDKTGTERKSAMDAHRAEVKKWASDNGIDLKYVMPAGLGMGGHHKGDHRPDDAR